MGERFTGEKQRKVLVTRKGTKAELIYELLMKDVMKPVQGTSFFQHLHTAKWQSKQFEKLRNNLPKGCILQVMDFAKNRTVVYQDEIKSAFYTQNQISMHPVVTYYRCHTRIICHHKSRQSTLLSRSPSLQESC
jgi:hypothetical protein